jgi:hypothetical protein
MFRAGFPLSRPSDTKVWREAAPPTSPLSLNPPIYTKRQIDCAHHYRLQCAPQDLRTAYMSNNYETHAVTLPRLCCA